MYRFGQVAHAVGLGEHAFRNWIRRNRIDLFEAQPESGWKTFSLNDVCVLAVAVQFVKYGAPVVGAVNEVRSALGGTNFETYEGLPEWLYGVELDGEWIVESNEGILGMRYSSGMAPASIRVHPARVMADARKRLPSLASEA